MGGRTRYVESRGLNIAYQIYGDGPIDLLVVNGFISHLDLMWADAFTARMLRRAMSFARVIVFDRAGVGLSDPVSTIPALEERTHELRAVLDAAESSEAALLAFSEAGLVSAYFAASDPGRVTKIILWSCLVKGRPDEMHPWGISEAAYQMMDDALAHWGEGRFVDIVAPSVAGSRMTRRFFGTFERASASPGTAAAIIRATREIDVTDVLRTITAPTLVIGRTGDTLVPIEQTRFIADGIKGSKLLEVPGRDHSPTVGDSELQLDAIEEFLTGKVEHHDPDRMLATVMFTDIVGSTEQLARVGDRAWRGIMEQHDEIAQESMERFEGTAVKSLGDGFLAHFCGPVAAVSCAIDISIRVAQLGLKIRAGIHTGEVEIIGEDIAGLTVNLAARIAPLAGSGEILVSRASRDLLANSGITCHPRGVHKLKGIRAQTEVFLAGPREAPPITDRRLLRLADRATLSMSRRVPAVARFAGKLAGSRV